MLQATSGVHSGQCRQRSLSRYDAKVAKEPVNIKNSSRKQTYSLSKVQDEGHSVCGDIRRLAAVAASHHWPIRPLEEA